MSDKELKRYEYYLGRMASERDILETSKDEGIEVGIKKGIEQGVENEKVNTAKNSIHTGLTNETIKIITGLSFQQIDKIREELKTK